ncbi:alpha/beta fold hydrolase [Tsukamurella sp. 8F]|uniref:alpha/beta fold hydrolase n=1 Tax=unclassified Tsukamurella TaxID=2633480 RepID=UPI0023B8F4C2|nr:MULTISPECIES: alpha/beta fold hydrolase [unclassified Tsukamurella]MDF0529675.1 alpha/beta fold hydrolase [Tsukamurella sp. 8J]MDF0585960.1 alpha/beta fold hydrolase [Tsukamurella sp. 8F]
MVTDPEPGGVLGRIRREVERNALRARNGIKMAAGLSAPRLGASPKDTVWRNGRARLFHYRNDDVRRRPPLLIVFSLISRSYILDLTPGNSFVEHLQDAGFDVYLLDWGEPDERDALNDLEYYVDGAIPAAIREVHRTSGADRINLLGYCFGGVLTLLHAAHHPDTPIRSLTVIACPVDLKRMEMVEIALGDSPIDVEAVLDEDGNVPASVVYNAFRTLRPVAEVTGYVDLLEKLWSDDYVAAYQAMQGWGTDHIPLPGAVARQLVGMLYRDDAMMSDRLVIGGDRVHLNDITVPFLSVLGKKDHIVPEAAAAPVLDLVGSADKTDLRLAGGHVGLVVGRTAAKTTIPTIIEFLEKQSEPLT